MLKWKKDSFQRKVYEGIFLGNRVQAPTFFLHFDVTPPLPLPAKKGKLQWYFLIKERDNKNC